MRHSMMISAMVLAVVFAMGLQAKTKDDPKTVSTGERAALVALYTTTDGESWLHRDGWMGAAGTECTWYGVRCSMGANLQLVGKMSVVELDLRNNGLKGDIPQELGALRGLTRLELQGNNISRPVPEVLLEKWDAGLLEVEPLSLIHDVDRIFIDVHNPSMRCYGYQASLDVSGNVAIERRLCKQTPNAETKTVCGRQQGNSNEVHRLGRFLDRSRFFGDLTPPAGESERELGGVTLTAKRSAKGQEYRSTAPISLSDWSLAVMLEGIVSRVQWTVPSTEVPCSSSGSTDAKLQ